MTMTPARATDAAAPGCAGASVPPPDRITWRARGEADLLAELGQCDARLAALAQKQRAAIARSDAGLGAGRRAGAPLPGGRPGAFSHPEQIRRESFTSLQRNHGKIVAMSESLSLRRPAGLTGFCSTAAADRPRRAKGIQVASNRLAICRATQREGTLACFSAGKRPVMTYGR
jgi:hypothetical protein